MQQQLENMAWHEKNRPRNGSMRDRAEKQVQAKLVKPLVERFLNVWGEPGLTAKIDVSFSGRLRTSLGLAEPGRRRVRLNRKILYVDHAVLEETLCHELAHIVAHHRHGRVRPHGREWRALMVAAGYRPDARFKAEESPIPLENKLYLHSCPVCQVSRKARRVMKKWRCRRCVIAGRRGELEIVQIGT